MPNLDIFSDDAFGMMTLTDAINKRQFVPSMIRNMGLFRSRGVTTTKIAIEQHGTQLKLIPNGRRGEPPAERVGELRDVRDLRTLHLSKAATIYADQVQGVRAFGTENQTQVVQDLVNQEIGNIGAEFDLTEENLMKGALQGKLIDADGQKVIYDFFDEFDVAEPAAIDFALATDTTEVRSKCTEVIRTMATNMQAGGMDFTVGALASDDFFDALINHANVKAAYERYQDGAALRSDYTYDSFRFAGINFINYRGSDDGEVGIAAGDCRFFPMGVPGLFEIVYAPADRDGIVNSMGIPRYVLPNNEDTGNGRYRKFDVQSNPLPYCTRPQTLLRGTA